MSESETPDGPRNEEPEVTPEEIPAETAQESVTEEPAAQEDAPASEPAVPAEPAVAEPAAPAQPEPVAEAAEPAPAEAAAPEADAPPSDTPAAAEEDVELAPRVRPEIPGADLTPLIVTEGEEFLDAEARAAAEADAEAATGEEDDADHHAQPIADAAINLASGARYTATGKRKSAVARVILKPGTGAYTINGKDLDTYFPRATLGRIIRQPLETVGYESRMDVVARMHGGGVAAQAGALRHGISKALLEADPNLRGELKRRGFLTRDPRVKERKKAGLKKARKRPQFSKR